MASIPLGNGKSVNVDDSDLEWLSHYKWELNNTGYAYTRIKIGIENGKTKRKYILMHRMITGCVESLVTDHADGDRLNNSRSNLRVCTVKENQRNRFVNRTNSLQLKGVREKRGKYQANIKYDGNRLCLGVYETKEEAARAYDQAALLYFGEFAKLNAV